MTAFWIVSPIMCLIIRFYLNRENRHRQRRLTGQDSDSDGDELIDTGSEIVKIGAQDLDKTDRENLKFTYPL